MFNLNKKINEWKKSLHKNPSFEEGYIEELESHLRDLIEEKIKEGKSTKESFEFAVGKIGKVNDIGEEYFKSDTTNKISGRPSWKSPRWMPDLIWNYFKVAVRNIKKYKSISLTNIFGLSIGIASVLLISMLVIYEMSFDQFHENKSRIFRVYTETHRPEGEFVMACVMFPFAPAAEEEIPEIEHAVRFCESSQLVANGDKKFYEKLIYTDENIFNVFSFPLKYGDKEKALSQKNTVVISEKIAEKYFGNENPVGKTLLFLNKDNYKVAGVFYDLPHNSSIEAEILASIKSLYTPEFPRLENWTSFSNDYTFLLLKKGSSAKAVEEKFELLIKKNVEPELADRYVMKMQNINEIHFSDLNYEFVRTIPPLYIYIFMAVASFILFIACINFINLSTARSARRGKEVGIRKVAGASRFQLVKQFLSESFIITIISLFVSLIITYYLLPEINSLLRSNLSFSLFYNVDFVLIIIALVFVTSIAAGLYPAFVLSNAKPVSVMKGDNQKNNKGYYLRAVLIVFQFALSVFLIISTITIYNQAEFLTKHNPGFNDEQMLVVPIYDPQLNQRSEALKNALLSDNNILNVTFSSGTPASGSTSTSNFVSEGKNEDEEIHMQILEIDYDFIKTYGLQVLEGREFLKEFSADEKESYLINETAAKKFGFELPIGKKIKLGDEQFQTIVGVIKDFNYSSLREEISPTVFKLNTSNARFLSLQINTAETERVVEFVKENVAAFSPNYPVEYYFMNERFENYYKAERTIGKLLSAFSIIAVIISCIGILGLVSFVAEQKSKEIGIRKVLGASVGSILLLIGKQFIKWIAVSNIIVWPLAHMFLNKWLNNFAYRVDINYLVFAGTLAGSILLAFITMGYHTFKAAYSNPVNSLRTE
ncbi:MAG: ABC transporter permease [Bacteroidetes bacterium]|nr:ABC transporter permease [Bacteroidota bacterium]